MSDRRNIFVQNIPFGVHEHDVEAAIANILHSPKVAATQPGSPILPLNFKIRIWKQKRLPRATQGTLLIPVEEYAVKFLNYVAKYPILLHRVALRFKVDVKRSATRQQFDALLTEPYYDTQRLARRREIDNLQAVALANLQFGTRSRHGRFTCEMDTKALGLASGFQVVVHAETRHLRVDLQNPQDRLSHIAVRLSSVEQIWVDANSSAILVQLDQPPRLEGRSLGSHSTANLEDAFDVLDLNDEELRPDRLSFIPRGEAASPFALQTIRFVAETESRSNLASLFQQIVRLFNLEDLIHIPIPLSTQAYYTIHALASLDVSLAQLSPAVAYQAQKLVSNHCLSPTEMQSLIPDINLMAQYSEDAACTAMEQLANDPHLERPFFEEVVDNQYQYIDARKRWTAALRATVHIRRRGLLNLDINLRCGQVKVTPTSYRLEGPIIDRSNRVLRMFPDFHDYFLRVTFCEEDLDNTHFTNRTDITQTKFVRERFGTIMKKGLRLAGRTFQFLAYSQSGLRAATVWFVSPFRQAGVLVTAERIRAQLGDFSLIITKPARYAARLSQAFSATYRSISLRSAEVDLIPDIERNGYCFSDGVGGISLELAIEVTAKLFGTTSVSGVVPSAFQIRWGGCKGMLFLNPALHGRKITIRPSMKQFDAPAALDLEIAEVFTEPKPCLLNRPLIKILEDLGAPIDAFIRVQQVLIDAIDAQSSKVATASKLLRNNGLGGVFEVPNVLKAIASMRLDFDDLPTHIKHFLEDSLTFAKVSMLRDVKFHGRIPLAGCFTLVGGVDESFELKEGEVCICIETTPEGWQQEPKYITGDVIITRSPVMHPGDVRVLRGIVPPKSNNVFLMAQKNVVIFSAQGGRPECSKMGGGDLDGDLYNVITEAQRGLWPRFIAEAGHYAPATIKDLFRPSTIDDVADFVTDYLNMDIVGVVAKKHLIIADQQPAGTLHPDCLFLSDVHSRAVDFPKSGTPVNYSQLPHPPHNLKPDFESPETIFQSGDSSLFYPSKKALGELYRNVVVPNVFRYRRQGQSLRSEGRSGAGNPSFDVRASAAGHCPYITEVKRAVSYYIPVNASRDKAVREVEGIMQEFCWEAECIARSYKFSGKSVTEEELFMSVLGAQVKHKYRKDHLVQIKQQSNLLLSGIRSWLRQADEGLGEYDKEVSILEYAYCAWDRALQAETTFGAVSFHLVALHAIYECLQKLPSTSGRA